MFSSRMLKVAGICVGVLFSLFLVLLIFLYYAFPTTSPFTAIQDYVYAFSHPHKALTKSVVAFLPYWRLEDTKYTHFDSLSEIIYFSLTIDGKGNIVKVNGNETDPGWRWWQSQQVKDLIAKSQITGNMFTLTFANSLHSTIEQFLTDTHAQQNFIAQAKQQLVLRHLNGVNLDFEYDGSPSAELRDAFTDFSTSFAVELRKENPQVRLSIDLLPSGGRKPSLIDVAKLKSVYDRFILMTYDYYGANSEVAGPVAPLYGFPEKKFLLDVNTSVLDYKKLLPAQKILLGIPYYGWDWPVVNGSTFMSATLDESDANGYPEVISYGRMKQDKDLVASHCMFDTFAREPWCWYTDQNTHKQRQVWFENDESIKEKFQFVQNQSLGGIAIWTLGYDKAYENLWDLITENFTLKK